MMAARSASARTIAGVLRDRAFGARSDQVAIRFLEGGQWMEWSWARYWTAAEQAAASLLECGVKGGDHVLIVTPDVRASVTALFGLWTIGAVPIQIGLPFQLQNRGEFMANLAETASRLNARFLLTAPALCALAEGGPRVLSTDDLSRTAGVGRVPDPDAVDGLAFIQLTSGSTSHPRGVMIPHDRLMLHMRSMCEALPSHSGSAGVSWLPLHHDMGLLGGLLFPFYNGFAAHMISTIDFQARPGVWLETMSRFRGTIAAAPPSAYSLCVQLAPRLLARGIDLSAWECAMVGAEPIPASLLRKFCDVFEPAGFRRNAYFPVYGLAEATVAVTFPKLLGTTRFDRIDRAALEQKSEAVPSPEDSLVFVGVGKPLPGTEVRVARLDGVSLPERHAGEVCVRSTSLSTGYYGDPGETASAFRGDWLRTGDLGYLAEGDLFITGRMKEIIIKAGQNMIPSVLEEIAGAVPGVRAGAVAAVGVRSTELVTEFVCIVAETRYEPGQYPALAETVRLALKARGVAVDKVVLLPPKSLPKTTSGKLKRLAIAEMMAERFR
ncbi:MAG: AMP-binding protein [Acidobacteriota bacterium]|nr:AMP-binding protein [Acidobacteriota bacterium]